MAWKKPTINEIKVDIKKLLIYIRTIKKFGKTTLFRDVILEKYGDPSRGMLIKIGAEDGDNMLDELNSTQVTTWKDFEDMKTWLIKEKGNEHNVEILCFDVADEFFPILEKEVVRLSNIDSAYKKCQTINGAFGGYSEGKKKAVQMAKDYFLELKKAGFGIWVLAHTKYKAIKEKGDIEDGYMSLTSPLSSDYEGVFGDVFDCVLTGMIDRELDKEVLEVDDKGKEKIKKTATAEIRKLYLRGTTSIDAGCRFTDGAVPEYIEFNQPDMSRTFIDVMEKGMELSKSKYKKGNVLIQKQDENPKHKEMIKEENIDSVDEDVLDNSDLIENDQDNDIVDEEKNTELKKQFTTKYKDATPEQKQEVKKVLSNYQTNKIDIKKPTRMFEELLKIFE